MSAAQLLERPTTQTTHHAAPTPGNLPDNGQDTSMVSCPVCGSGSTYQTMNGRWGCTSCGSSWG